MESKLTQTGLNGRTRTFRFVQLRNGVALHVDIRAADGKMIGEDLSYHFTDAEFEQFGKLVEAAA